MTHLYRIGRKYDRIKFDGWQFFGSLICQPQDFVEDPLSISRLKQHAVSEMFVLLVQHLVILYPYNYNHAI